MIRMRIFLTVCIILLQTFLLSRPIAAKNPHLFKVGVATRAFTPPEPYNWRGAKTHQLLTSIWYPAAPSAAEQSQFVGPSNAPFALAGSAAPDAPFAAAPAKFPLILLSHGTGGSALMMAWLGTALASHGYIAAAVNHPGNNALKDYTIQGFSLWQERAKDLSTLIDLLLADSALGPRIDPNRIGAAGFSLGGFTVIEIAGGLAELSRYQEFCSSPRKDGMCIDPPEFPNLLAKTTELAKSDPDFQAALRDAAKPRRDPRVRAIFAMAPALGPAFSVDSLEKISVPSAVVAGTADTNVPPDTSAKFFAAHIPGAKLTLFTGVGHYTFLATCAELGRRNRPDLCVDPAGVLRDDIHKQTADLAAAFFSSALK
ncbi:MAG TPA: alpha/beta hydrolase [Candidatus Acidoferrum sp.]|nr:alpha/beta hydrolase [Candidatus Acidoferrum sp.]